MSSSTAAITLYGAHWCPDCRRAKQFLGEHQIPYAWVDIEQDAAAEQYVIEKNNGKRIIPTIVFEDGSSLVEPSNAELAAKFGLKTAMDRKHFPVIVVGGGPAGLTTALYTAREGIDADSGVSEDGVGKVMRRSRIDLSTRPRQLVHNGLTLQSIVNSEVMNDATVI